MNLPYSFERLWSDHFGQILACWNLFRLDKILPCFLERIYLDQIVPGTLEELGVNLVNILANQNLARQSWLFMSNKNNDNSCNFPKNMSNKNNDNSCISYLVDTPQ